MRSDDLDFDSPRHDFADQLVHNAAAPLPHAARALHAYDVAKHTHGLRHILTWAQKAMPAPAGGAMYLSQMRTLADAAMLKNEHVLILGFVGRIWRPGAAYEMPPADAFAEAVNQSPHDAGIVWRLRALAVADRSRYVLDMRLTYPTDAVSRALCRAYWTAASGVSRRVRQHVLRCMARLAESYGSAR